MTELGDKIKKDDVVMRWIRTAATTVITVTGALGIAWGVIAWTVEPRVNDWATGMIDTATADIRTEADRQALTLDRLEGVVASLEQNIDALSTAIQGNVAPSWRFSLPDTHITDGRIGGEVTITAGGYKLRECGIPRVDLYFVNGRGVYHRFVDTSLLSTDGRGVAFPVDPDRLQTVSYTARIPDDGVTPGRGHGFISITYPDTCPAVQEVVAGPLQFRILPDE